MKETRIAELRRERGWTQERLAAASGVGVRTVQRLESGTDASLETLHQVAAALGVSVQDLFHPPAAEAAEPPTAAAGSSRAPGDPTRRRRRTLSRRAVAALAIAVAAGVVVGGAAGLAVGLAPAPLHSATSQAFVAVTSTTSPEGLDADGRRTAEVVRSDAAIATTPLVLNRVIDELSLPSTATELARRVEVTSPSGTAVLHVTARASSEAEAVRLSDAVTRSLAAVVPSLTPSKVAFSNRVTPIRAARPDPAPGPLLPAVLGGGGGALLGLAAAVVVLVLRGRSTPPRGPGRAPLLATA